LYKIGLPTIWIGFVGSPVLSEAAHVVWFVLPLLIFGAVVIWIFVAPLKVVRIDHAALYVSNYRKEIRIPLSQVDDVIDAWIVNIYPITIFFRTETEFGRQIVFMPTVRLLGSFGRHPIVDELQDAIRRAKPV
jgi:hypothetical protein